MSTPTVLKLSLLLEALPPNGKMTHDNIHYCGQSQNNTNTCNNNNTNNNNNNNNNNKYRLLHVKSLISFLFTSF